MSDSNSKDKLKVLAIVPTAFCYGLQHITLDFFSSIKVAVEAHFLVTRWNDGEFVRELESREIAYSYSWLGMFSRRLDWVNLKMSLNCLIKLPALYRDLFRLVRRFNPDVLYFANHHELVLLTPVLKLMRRPVVCHMHDPSPNGKFQKISFRYLYGRRVDRYIAISEDVKRRTMILGCPEAKISVVHNGVKISPASSPQRGNKFVQQFGWPESAFVVGITGQMTETKGHIDVIKAIASLEDRKNLYLVIGGKKIEPYFGRLTQLIEECGLQEQVGFCGWQEDVDDFFRNINVFTLASRHDEGYGLVVAQAMVMNKPVIATASGGVVELVENDVTGFLVPKQSVPEMAAKIDFLQKNPARSVSMGMAGRQRVEQLYDIKKQVILLQQFLSQTAEIRK
ncbi:MAG: glycosyltransferase family 4 protein [Bacteroidetes bacterium]|nr:glycosyltransferase family 4 protein [Bacteroidota bacterium]